MKEKSFESLRVRTHPANSTESRAVTLFKRFFTEVRMQNSYCLGRSESIGICRKTHIRSNLLNSRQPLMENSYEILLILHEKSLTFLQNNRQFRKRVFLARNKGSSLTPSLINLSEPMINSEEKSRCHFTKNLAIGTASPKTPLPWPAKLASPKPDRPSPSALK